MFRREPASLLWIPGVAILGIATLAEYSARFSDTIYWALTSVLFMILVLWKMHVGQRAMQTQESEPTPEQIAKLRPYGYLFLALYFLSATVFLGYGAAVWYYQLDFSWTFFVTFLSLFAIKVDVWAIIVRHAMSDSHISSQP